MCETAPSCIAAPGGMVGIRGRGFAAGYDAVVWTGCAVAGCRTG